MSALALTLFALIPVACAVLIVRALAHRGSELAERDWADRIGEDVQ